MKLVDNIDSNVFLSEEDQSNTIYKKEILRLRDELEKINAIHENLCFELSNHESFLNFNKKNVVIKRKKLEKIINLNELYEIIKNINSLKTVFDLNIRNVDSIDINYIYHIFREIMRDYYNAINIIRFARKYKSDKKHNPLFDLYLENQKSHEMTFYSSDECINLIKNNSIKMICIDLYNDYVNKKEEVEMLTKSINNSQKNIEKFFIQQRKKVSTLDELRWYKEILSTFSNMLEEKQKQKRI